MMKRSRRAQEMGFVVSRSPWYKTSFTSLLCLYPAAMLVSVLGGRHPSSFCSPTDCCYAYVSVGAGPAV